MIKDRYKLIGVVLVIFKKDDQYLLSHRSNTGYLDNTYGLVAGHLEKDESILAASIREAKEEAGVTIKAGDLRFVHILHSKWPDREDISIFFECSKWEGEIENKEPDKCGELAWFSKNDLPSNTIPYIKKVLEEVEKKNSYSEWGW